MLSIATLEKRISLYDAYVDAHFRKANGWACIDKDGQRAMRRDLGFAVTNDQRSRVEIARFKREKPTRYFAYMNEDENGRWTIQTFAGDILSDRVTIKATHRHSGNLSKERVYFTCTGINGVIYHGMGFGSGTYCRMQAAKGGKR